MQAEGRREGTEGWEWKWGGKAFSSLATLFLAQEKTGLLVLVCIHPAETLLTPPHGTRPWPWGTCFGHQSEWGWHVLL